MERNWNHISTYGEDIKKGQLYVQPEHQEEFTRMEGFFEKVRAAYHPLAIPKNLAWAVRRLALRDRTTLGAVNKALMEQGDEKTQMVALRNPAFQSKLLKITEDLAGHRKQLKQRLLAEKKVSWHES